MGTTTEVQRRRARNRHRAAGRRPLLVSLALCMVASQCAAGGAWGATGSVHKGAAAAPVSFAALLKEGWQEGHNSHALHHHSEADGWRISLHGHHGQHHEAVGHGATSPTPAVSVGSKEPIDHAAITREASTTEGPPTEKPVASVSHIVEHSPTQAPYMGSIVAPVMNLEKPVASASPIVQHSPPQAPYTAGSIVAPVRNVAGLGTPADTGASGLLVPHSQKTVVLVGNGRSVLKHELGSMIDTYDIVGRFNYFELKGFSKNVGTKTNLWFLNEMKIPGPRRIRTKVNSFTSPRQMNLKIVPTMKYVVSVVYGYSKGCGPKSPQKCKISAGEQKRVGKVKSELKAGYAKFKVTDKLELMKQNYQYLLATKYGYSAPFPSTGLLAIVYCLENFGAPVTITGFDFQEKSLGHYFEKVKKKWTSHSMKGELKFIARMKAAGMLRVI